MSSGLYRALLHLLPRQRRRAYGAEIVAVFEELRRSTAREAGSIGVGLLWMREVGGLMKFSIREWLGRLRGRRAAVLSGAGSQHGHRGRWDLPSEIRWAWRGVRGRRWRAVVAGGLLALALAGNAIVFSAADALLFRRVPYPEADRLAGLGSMAPRHLAEWRRQTDVFAAVHGYVTRPVFLIAQDQPAIVDVVDLTPELIEMLGARPRWGRALTNADTRETAGEVVVLSERLARERFGSPQAAVGSRLETTGAPLLIVGVMPAAFRFPAGSYQIWRALNLQGRVRAVGSIGLLAPGQSLDTAREAVRARAAVVAATSGIRMTRVPVPAPFGQSANDRSRRLLYVLLGAALALLLTACANVVSFELAGAMGRARRYALQIALGASRGSLVRVALLEGLLILLPAAMAAAVLAVTGAELLASNIPARVFDSVNPIDFDGRAWLFMTAAAAVTWMVVSLPIALFALRLRLPALLKAEDRSAAASRISARLRQALTAIEVALAVLLLVAGVLYTRSYQSMVGLDKGFDSRNLAAISLTLPMQSYPDAQARHLLAQDVMARLAARSDVLAVCWPDTLPPGRGESHQAALEIDGRAIAGEGFSIGLNRVDERFFSTLGIPVREGRTLERAAAADDAVVDETFARTFWPQQSAIGRRFRISDGHPAMTVVGVVGHVRNDADDFSTPSDSHFQIYVQRQAPQPVPPQRTPQAINDLPLYGSLVFAARLAPAARPNDMAAVIRAIDSRFRLRVQSMDEIYASRFEDTLLATRVVGAFSMLSYLVATAGVFGLMAFLVAGRTREIGIRMALGADRRDISKLVLTSSIRMVLVGAGVGVAAALLLSRWVEAQFFGVKPTDPLTYGVVTGSIVVTALLATWQPARQAARVDPAITLRAE